MRFILLFAMVLALGACKKFDAEAQAETDENIITKYILDQGLNAIATGTGLYYVIDSLGSTVYPTLSNSVTVEYKGYFTDGTVFDQSTAAGATFALTAVIKGWQEGIQLYKEGGGGKLLVPSALGYGQNGTGSTPTNTVLIFDVHLIKVL